MSSTLTIGLEVVLISGGPSMTVSAIEDAKCFCQWFYDGTLRGEWFPTAAVKPYERPSPSAVRGRRRQDFDGW
jgi:uncharacterized protein YodC (DUF2158 family)